jgi:hypothetical protein
MDAHNYRAFMLRFWRENVNSLWRGSLEDPHSGERLSFASAERLLAYLAEQLKREDEVLQDNAETG